MKMSNVLTKILVILVISCFSFGAMARDASSFLPEQRIFADFIPQGKWEEVHASIPGSQFTDSTRTQLVRNFFTQVGWHEVQKREFTDASSNGVDFPRRFWELNPTLDELTKKGWISVEDFLEIVRGYGIYIPDMRSGVVAMASNTAQVAQAKVVTASAEVLRLGDELKEVKASLEQFRGRELSETDRKEVQLLLASKKELTRLHDGAVTAAREAKESAERAAASQVAAQTAASQAVTSALAAGVSEDAAAISEKNAKDSETKTDNAKAAAEKAAADALKSSAEAKEATSGIWAWLIGLTVALVAIALWVWNTRGVVAGVAQLQINAAQREDKKNQVIDRLVSQFNEHAKYVLLPDDFDEQVAAINGKKGATYEFYAECTGDAVEFLLRISNAVLKDQFLIEGIKDSTEPVALRNLRRSIEKAAKIGEKGRTLVGAKPLKKPNDKPVLNDTIC